MMNLRALGALFFLLLFGPWLQGQSSAAALSGVVTDTSGASVANASLVLVETGTGRRQQLLAAADGSFQASGLRPGVYRLEVEAPGYKRLIQTQVMVESAGVTHVTLTLTAGSVQDTVNATGATPLLRAESGERGQVFSNRQVRELPIVDRNYQHLIQLAPGVTPALTEVSPLIDPQRSRTYNINGQPFNANNWRLNKGDNNEPVTHLNVFRTPLEAVQQMNIRTSSYDAEVGRTGGLTANSELRAGGNRYHGSAFWFNSVDELRGRDFFNALTEPDGDGREEFLWNQFGASFGGPVPGVENLFFTGNYEGTFVDYERPQFATVPAGAFRQGDFSAIEGLRLYDPATGDPNGMGRQPFPNNQIPASRFSPQAQQILGSFPAPNRTGLQNNLQAFAPLRNDSHVFDGRTDYRWNENNTVFGHFNYGKYFVLDDDPLGRAIGAGGESRMRTLHSGIGWTRTLSPNLQFDVRGNYNRFRNNINGLNGLDRIEITGMTGLGAPNSYPMNWIDNNFNVSNTWSWNPPGRHSWKFGVDIRHQRVDGFLPFNQGAGTRFEFQPGSTLSPLSGGFPAAGSFPSSFAGFLLGAPAAVTDTVQLQDPTYRRWFFEGFAQDKFRMTPKLTLTFGVRYSAFSPVGPANDAGLSNFNPRTNMLNIAGAGEVDNNANVEWDTNNISPRVGVAYQLSDKVVVRGGYSLTYFPNTINFATGSLFPALSSVQAGVPNTFGTVGEVPAIPFTSIPTAASVAADPRQPLNFIPQDPETPYVQSFHFTYERELTGSMMFDVSYVGTQGRQLPFRQDFNFAAPGTGVAGLLLNQTGNPRTARTLLSDNGGVSNYNAVQASVDKRFSDGLAFTAAYTFSRTLDDVSGEEFLLTSLDRSRNHGLADFDREHMFSLSHVWEVPVGEGSNLWNTGLAGKLLGHWQLNGILTWTSGRPFTVTSNPLFCNCPGNLTNFGNQVLPDPETTSGLGPSDFANGEFFQTAGFAQPGANALGNAGRNNLRGPDLFNYDLSIFRSFPVSEGKKLEFRAEFFNLTNTANFANPVSNVTSEDFGRITSTLAGSQGRFGSGRQVNFGLRFVF